MMSLCAWGFSLQGKDSGDVGSNDVDRLALYCSGAATQSRVDAASHSTGLEKRDHRSGGPFAALIVKNGEVIAEAVNTVFTTNDPTAHAEINAIRKACVVVGDFALRGCEIYSSSEPCPMCLAATYWAHLRAIYFGNSSEDAARAGFDDAPIFRQLSLDRDKRAIPSMQLIREEALESFRLWENSPDKREY